MLFPSGGGGICVVVGALLNLRRYSLRIKALATGMGMNKQRSLLAVFLMRYLEKIIASHLTTNKDCH